MLYARDIMTTEVLTVSPETSIADLSKTLENRQIGGVPVVDQGGRLVGVITQTDLLERARERRRAPEGDGAARHGAQAGMGHDRVVAVTELRIEN